MFYIKLITNIFDRLKDIFIKLSTKMLHFRTIFRTSINHIVNIVEEKIVLYIVELSYYNSQDLIDIVMKCTNVIFIIENIQYS